MASYIDFADNSNLLTVVLPYSIESFDTFIMSFFSGSIASLFFDFASISCLFGRLTGSFELFSTLNFPQQF
jgi:hypothetical protein